MLALGGHKRKIYCPLWIWMNSNLKNNLRFACLCASGWLCSHWMMCSTKNPIVTLLNLNWLSLNSLSRMYVVCCCCCCFFSDFLHQFHEMLIRCIHLFSLCIKYWSLRRQFPPYRVKEVKIASLNFYLRVQFSLVELGSDACNYFSRKAIGVLMIYLSYY